MRLAYYHMQEHVVNVLHCRMILEDDHEYDFEIGLLDLFQKTVS